MTIRNFFLLITSHHDVSIKELYFKQTKNRTQIFNYGPARQARQKIETSCYWKFIEVTHWRNSGRGRGSSVIIILLKPFFLQNSWSCPQAYRGADRRQKSPLDGATDFLAPIWQNITTSSFVYAFILVLTRKPKNASKRVWIGPKLNLVHFKSVWGCLLIDSLSRVDPLYDGKRL